MEQTIELRFNNHKATIIRPENPNGKWIWKTEFLYAFDQAEKALVEKGYTRVYYQVSNRYGGYAAIRLMKKFYNFITEEFALDKKCCLFGFSRGGLYAFNFALFYPECVEKIYLDAPVLDMRTWPWEDSPEQAELLVEYGLNKESLETFSGHPIENLEEFFSLNIPLLIVAGGVDEVVDFSKNSGRLIEYCEEHDIGIRVIVKPNCKHHPHSLEDISPIISFIEEK